MDPSHVPAIVKRQLISEATARIEAHGGRLWAADSFGRGAIFQFTLPGVTRTYRDKYRDKVRVI